MTDDHQTLSFRIIEGEYVLSKTSKNNDGYLGLPEFLTLLESVKICLRMDWLNLFFLGKQSSL